MKVEPIRDLEDVRRIEHILRQYGYRRYMAFKIATNSALRIGDVCRLKVSQVRNRWLTLNEEKTRKYRRIYINDELRPILDDYTRYMAPDDYLLRSVHENRKPNSSTFYRTIRDAGHMIGLSNLGTHSCRKTFAYHHYREHQNIALLMTILNHTNERETLIYIGVMQDEIDHVFATTFI